MPGVLHGTRSRRLDECRSVNLCYRRRGQQHLSPSPPAEVALSDFTPPPPLREMPGADALFRTFVLWDHEVRGEVLGTVTYFDPDYGGTWGVQLHPVHSDGYVTVWLYDGASSKLGRWHVIREATHPVDWLVRQAERVAPYPAGTTAVPARIPGTAFFPGGSGLVKSGPDAPLPRFPVGGVMVIGQDFDTVDGYRRSCAEGAERLTSPTWRGLIELFGHAGVSVSDCFFTNAFAGLRVDGPPTGPFPGAVDTAFTDQCGRLLGAQIALQRPRLVITLGGKVPRMLATLAPAHLAAWQDVASVAELDARGAALVGPVVFDTAPETSAVVVALTHPSFRHINVDARRYGTLSGDAAEVALLKRALANIGDPTDTSRDAS